MLVYSYIYPQLTIYIGISLINIVIYTYLRIKTEESNKTTEYPLNTIGGCKNDTLITAALVNDIIRFLAYQHIYFAVMMNKEQKWTLEEQLFILCGPSTASDSFLGYLNPVGNVDFPYKDILDIPFIKYLEQWEDHDVARAQKLSQNAFNEYYTTIDGLKELRRVRNDCGYIFSVKTSVLSTLVVEHHFSTARRIREKFSACQYSTDAGKVMHDMFCRLSTPKSRGFHLPDDSKGPQVSSVYGAIEAEFQPIELN
jgi:hypothetical protein